MTSPTQQFVRLGNIFRAQGDDGSEALKILIYLVLIAAMMIYGSYRATARVCTAIP